MLLIKIGQWRDKQVVHCRGGLCHMCSSAGGFGGGANGGKVAWQGLLVTKYVSIGL